jgi:hypothetical protein
MKPNPMPKVAALVACSAGLLFACRQPIIAMLYICAALVVAALGTRETQCCKQEDGGG